MTLSRFSSQRLPQEDDVCNTRFILGLFVLPYYKDYRKLQNIDLQDNRWIWRGDLNETMYLLKYVLNTIWATVLYRIYIRCSTVANIVLCLWNEKHAFICSPKGIRPGWNDQGMLNSFASDCQHGRITFSKAEKCRGRSSLVARDHSPKYKK